MNASKTLALIITGIFIIISFVLVIYILESPVFDYDKKKKEYAVIAIRDNVSPFQKSGTQLFTFPYLRKKYSEVVYYTQNYYDEHRDDFIHSLTRLLDTNDSVDVFLLAHGNIYYKWVEEIDSKLRKKIRLVYNTGCSGSLQASFWEELGVHCYVAHRSPVSISPVFYFYFLRRYCKGYPLDKAINESNRMMHKNLHRLNVFTFGYTTLDPVVEQESEGKIVIKQ
jgi:hypothetical protein